MSSQNFEIIQPPDHLCLFIKSIWLLECKKHHERTVLPFYADGYPGMMYHQSPNGLKVNPHQKSMPGLFLYGQTLQPIEIDFIGPSQLIIFQLYPFVIKTLFDIEPVSINDGCYGLENLIFEKKEEQFSNKSITDKVDDLSKNLFSRIASRNKNFDPGVKMAIQEIIKRNGLVAVKDVAEELKISEKTLGRKFKLETGLLPKQFSKIIQFQSSLEQLKKRDYVKLTDVVYQNGYADQSHFIKVFKAFTGKTPKAFNPRII